MTDIRHRFYMQASPVRGEWVCLDDVLATIQAQRAYPQPIVDLLAQLLTASALLASTIKFVGRLSIQAQASEASRDLKWMMAECSSSGELRALAAWHDDSLLLNTPATSSQMVFEALRDGVLFINIEPEQGERYQGIIELKGQDLAACLEHYYEQSAQTRTLIKLATSHVGQHTRSVGLLLQLLPHTSVPDDVIVDSDLWPRMQMLTQTLSDGEMLETEAAVVLYRLYHEEQVVLSQPQPLRFGCTCSRDKCAASLIQLGYDAAQQMVQEDDGITMDCQFCNSHYHFDDGAVRALFDLHRDEQDAKSSQEQIFPGVH